MTDDTWLVIGRKTADALGVAKLEELVGRKYVIRDEVIGRTR